MADTAAHPADADAEPAVADSHFHLLFQPIYDLDDGALAGFEALLRWNHPERGELQPEEFLPELESSGDIVEVGRWVLAESCRHMTRWREHGHELAVSVNVSPAQLADEGIVDDVHEVLEVTGMPPEALTLEVTEAALVRNADTTARRLRALKELGVRIAIDDFGTSSSTVTYLRQFPIDCLKIDRTFVDALSRSPQSEALVHTLVQLGRDLGLRTLAEGVETPEQMARLRNEDVHAVQGFLFARPMTVAAIDAQLGALTAQRVVAPAAEIRAIAG